MSLIKHDDFKFDDLYVMQDALSSSTDVYIFIWDIKNSIFRISKKFLDDFDFPSEVVENVYQYWNALVHPDDIEIFQNAINELFTGVITGHDIEYRMYNRQNEIVWVRCRGTGCVDGDGDFSTFFGVLENITTESKFDYITGLMTRSNFQTMLASTVENDGQGFVMIMGIDHFKGINDKYGQDFGDDILKYIGKVLMNNIPKNTKIFRLDGDRFGIICSCDDIEMPKAIYESVKLSIGSINKDLNKNLFYTISCGISEYPKDSSDSIMLQTYSENALYMAKVNGRNQCVVFSSSIYEERIKKINIQEILVNSIENDFKGFKLVFQPQVDTETGNVHGAEALIRFDDPEHGKMFPDEFIGVLEKTMLIIPVGRWVIDKALDQLAVWSQIYPDFIMSINMSFVQIKDRDLVGYVIESIRKRNLNPLCVVLELTESSWIPDLNIINKTFEVFREYGIRIAIDDFGTGYSALNYLKEMPVDIIKIDRCFVNKITYSEFDYNFIRFIIELSHSINKEICIEGVETQEELDKIKKLNPDYIQGYFFYRPIPPDEITNILKEEKKQRDK